MKDEVGRMKDEIFVLSSLNFLSFYCSSMERSFVSTADQV
jgi:hypothetical protein